MNAPAPVPSALFTDANNVDGASGSDDGLERLENIERELHSDVAVAQATIAGMNSTEDMQVDEPDRKKRNIDTANEPSKEEGLVLYLKQDDPLATVFSMMPEDQKRIVLSFKTTGAQKHMIEMWSKAVNDDRDKRTQKLLKDEKRRQEKMAIQAELKQKLNIPGPDQEEYLSDGEAAEQTLLQLTAYGHDGGFDM